MQQSSRLRRRALSALGALALTGCIIGNGDRPSTTNLSRAPLIHRTAAPVCASSAAAEPDLSGVTNATCVRNEDCTGGTNARCVVTGTSSQCETEMCQTSIDCPGVAVCECGATGNACVANGCLDDAACGKDGYCSPTQGACGKKNLFSTLATTDGYPHHCHTKDDLCFDDADCVAGGYCRYEADSRTWDCTTNPCP